MKVSTLISALQQIASHNPNKDVLIRDSDGNYHNNMSVLLAEIGFPLVLESCQSIPCSKESLNYFKNRKEMIRKELIEKNLREECPGESN